MEFERKKPKGLKEKYPNAHKELEEMKRIRNLSATDIKEENVPKPKIKVYRENLEIPTQDKKDELKETRMNRKKVKKKVRVNHVSKVYRTKKPIVKTTFSNFIKENKLYTFGTVFAVFFVALITNLIVSLITDVALGLLFFVLTFSFLFTFFQEEYIDFKSSLISKNNQMFYVKQRFKNIFKLLGISTLFTIPYVAVYGYLFIYLKVHQDFIQNFI